MRVSERMLFQSGARGLRLNASALLKAQDQVSSGKRVSLASDDPVSAKKILNYNKMLAEMEQHQRNSLRAEDFLSATDSALNGVQDQIQKVAARAVEMSNPAMNSDDRRIVAREVQQIFDQITTLANTSHEGQFIFSGNQIDTAPFDFNQDWQGKYVGAVLPEEIEIAAYNPDEPEGSGNDQINVTVDGVTVQVTLDEGTYTGEEIADHIQTKINDALSENDLGVTVLFVPETVFFDPNGNPGHLEAQSNTIRGRSSVVFNKVVQPEPDPLAPVQPPALGDARNVLGFLDGKSQFSGQEYLGDESESSILISHSVLVPKNLAGSRVFKGAQDGVDIFASLLNFKTALEMGDMKGIQTAISDMDKATEQVSGERATIGIRLVRLEDTKNQMESAAALVKEFKSNEEDIDLTEAISEMVLKQNALTASQSVFARILQQPTLLNFLQ
ncbi:MAG: flagellar hook-associated protein FlgL [Nitrospirota bacterium]